jgi:hypothetical protein
MNVIYQGQVTPYTIAVSQNGEQFNFLGTLSGTTVLATAWRQFTATPRSIGRP